MKNVIFIVSHLNSGSSEFVTFLNKNPRIDIKNPGLTYDHPLVIKKLISLGHKLDNASAIYGDQILFNFNLGSKYFYSFAKFIYIMRPATDTLKELLFEKSEMSEDTAVRYYSFRLRRMYEMARQTPKALFLTYDDILNKKGESLVEDYLSTKSPVVFDEFKKNPQKEINSLKISSYEDIYEKYLYLFRNLDLIQTNRFS